jgi:hypothetical protein
MPRIIGDQGESPMANVVKLLVPLSLFAVYAFDKYKAF